MNDSRRLVRQDRLQKFVRLLSGRFNINVILPEDNCPDILKKKTLMQPTYYGYSDSKRNIWINPKIDSDLQENLIQQKSVALHEMGHVLFTDGELWVKSGVNHVFCNIIEDGRVEEAVARNYPKARSYFFYLNEKIGKSQAPIKSLPLITAEFLLRTAKQSTGFPPMSSSSDKKLKKKLKEDYEFLGSRVRKAVLAPTEIEAIQYTKEIEEKWNKLFGKDKKLSVSMTRTPYESISSKCKSQQPMPPSLPGQSKSQNITEEQKEGEGKGNKDKKESKEGEGEPKEQSKEKKGSGGGESKDQEQKGKKKAKSAKALYEEDKKKAKEEIEKDIKQEIQAETKEEQSKKADPKFDSYKHMTNDSSLREGESIHTPPLEPVAQRIVHIFKVIAQRGKGWERNQTVGKIDNSHLFKVANDKGETRVFKQMVQEKQKTDLSVAILLDISASMEGISLLATESTYVIARALELAKLNSEIVTFGVSSGQTKCLYGLKSFNQSLQYAKSRFIPQALGNTPLYPALEGAQKSLNNVKSKKKLIIVVTDGDPNVGGGPSECKQKIKEIESTGISVVGILINTKDHYEIFQKTNQFTCCNVSDLPIKMQDIIKNILMSIKR